MNREPIGLYLHIPFCRSKCPYCDFCSYPHPSSELMETYTHELARRIRVAGDRLRGESGDGRWTIDYLNALQPVDTVYFGGGTPSILPTRCLRELLGAIHPAEETRWAKAQKLYAD